MALKRDRWTLTELSDALEMATTRTLELKVDRDPVDAPLSIRDIRRVEEATAKIFAAALAGRSAAPWY